MAAFERRPMTLEHLLNFNDELIGLIRAGLPLDLGLHQLG